MIFWTLKRINMGRYDHNDDNHENNRYYISFRQTWTFDEIRQVFDDYFDYFLPVVKNSRNNKVLIIYWNQQRQRVAFSIGFLRKFEQSTIFKFKKTWRAGRKPDSKLLFLTPRFFYFFSDRKILTFTGFFLQSTFKQFWKAEYSAARVAIFPVLFLVAGLGIRACVSLNFTHISQKDDSHVIFLSTIATHQKE